MARFLRKQPGSYGHSRLQPPVVVAEPVVPLAPPLQVSYRTAVRAARRLRFQSALNAPVVVSEEVTAPPIVTAYRAAVRVRPPHTSSFLQPPLEEEPPPPPPPPALEENLAPNIYGYGAM
jgi:hypothetical protein